MELKTILLKCKEFIRDAYRKQPGKDLPYHNFEHSSYVVANTRLIAKHYHITEQEMFVVTVAAWFHDLGHLDTPDSHEQRSAEQAEAFLRTNEVPELVINDIVNCILATRTPQNPVSLVEKILCDADLFGLGTMQFFKNNKMLRKERNERSGSSPGKIEWYRQTLVFLNAHHFHTDYCQQRLGRKKLKNVKEIQRLIVLLEKKENKHAGVGGTTTEIEAGQAQKNIDLSWNRKDRPEKGIETMFKISSGNHQRLSGMADNKAHILITVNSIILSAIISILLRKLNEYGYLILPTCILLGVSLLAMTFAILATRPAIPSGRFQRSDVDAKKVNLLFFGNFFNMPLTEFSYGMERMMADHELLYGSLIRDVYAQGVVLGKKYRLLRTAYNIFMYGLIAAVAAFLIAAIFFSAGVPPPAKP